MLDSELGPQRRVPVLEGDEAVRTGREYPGHRMLLETRDVLACQLLKQSFFSKAPCWIASAAFAPAQQAIVYAKMVEDLDHGTAHRLSIRVKGTGTANPVQ